MPTRFDGWEVELRDSPVIGTAIHAGSRLRKESLAIAGLSEAERLREEDPFTDRLIADFPNRIIVHRSRFEVDLNRPRADAVYQLPDDAWGLDLWRVPPSVEEIERSRHLYDEFYDALGQRLDALASRGPFVVLDLHSYNHRRDGAHEPAAAEANPEINVGTGALDRARWGNLVDRFIATLAACDIDGHRLDARENIRFRGGELSRWVAQRHPGSGCALAIEFKKVFMDEWTGELDERHLGQLGDALVSVVPALLEEMQCLAPM
jgi:N-formylglutamate deformylase